MPTAVIILLSVALTFLVVVLTYNFTILRKPLVDFDEEEPESDYATRELQEAFLNYRLAQERLAEADIRYIDAAVADAEAAEKKVSAALKKVRASGVQ